MASKRLKKNSQFRTVYSEGSKEAGEKIVIYYLRREGEGLLPGFVASRRIGNAVKRSRAKRLMREIWRTIETRITEKNLWVVFVAAFRPDETTFRELLDDVERSLSRARLMS